MSLIEFLIGITLSAIVLAALGHAFLGSKVSFQLNRGYSILQDNSRFSLQNLETQIRMAGYQDRNISAGPVRDFLVTSPGENDAITIRFGAGAGTSITDCAGNPAPAHDRISITYSVNENGELECASETHFGATSTHVVASGIDQFRLQYGIDDNEDGLIDRTVRDPDDDEERSIAAVEICLVVTSGSVADALTHTHYDCDGAQRSTDDGLLRRRFTTTVNLRNQI